MRFVSWSILFGLVIAAPFTVIWGQTDPIWYDITDGIGIATPERLPASGRYRLPEAFDGKVLPFDFDQDGDLDLLMTYGPHVADSLYLGLNRFYRNDDTIWVDLTAETGLSLLPPAASAAAGDVDGDGYLDLYLCLFGADRFLHNDSGLTWIDITDSVGLSNDYWATEAVFMDANRDGYLDIYVANYLDYSGTDTIVCIDPISRRRTFCDPLLYEPAPNRLFINDSSGRFTDMTARMGLVDTTSRSLEVELFDANCDGYLDLFVLSDGSPNLLYLNTDSGYVEHGLYAGLAVTPAGKAPTWIDVLAFDPNLDGCDDVICFDRDANITIMLNDGRGLFFEGQYQTGFFQPRFPYKAMTAVATDADFDGHLDLILSNPGDVPQQRKLFFPSAGDSSAQVEIFPDEVLSDTQPRILLGAENYLFRPEKVSRFMTLDTVLYVRRRALITTADTIAGYGADNLIGPENLPPTDYEDQMDNPLFNLPVGPTQVLNPVLEEDSILVDHILDFDRMEREEFFEIDTLWIHQEPKSLVAVDLDQDGIEEVVVGYSAGLFRIWKRALERVPKFMGLWPQTRDPSVPVIGTKIQVTADRYSRQFLITDSNPILLYLPRKVRSVDVLVKWPDGQESRYRTPITNRIYTLTRMVQEP